MQMLCGVCTFWLHLQVKLIPQIIHKWIDLRVSIDRIDRFMDLPEVIPAPPAPPIPPPYVRWRTLTPAEDVHAPLLELRGAAFRWGEPQTIVGGSAQKSKPTKPNVSSCVRT